MLKWPQAKLSCYDHPFQIPFSNAGLIQVDDHVPLIIWSGTRKDGSANYQGCKWGFWHMEKGLRDP